MLRLAEYQQHFVGRLHAVFAQTTIAVSQILAAEEPERTQHEPYLVGVSVFVFLTVLLLATLSFNRNK